ncbi:MAG TPA: Crp/Fnr family transcriptional regulator [Acetobacteraceae bacterium]|jgi:CRP-like cAMP-binding protein|nr:Crp/Fnr family transcriptional regulator [Acetobacteraceae bacterium]
MVDRTQPWIAKALQAPVFAFMREADVSRLLGAATQVLLRDEQALFARGDPARTVYLILSGSVRISTSAASGKRITVSIFQRYDMIGEIAVVDRGTRTADAIAMGPVELASIPGSTFLDVLADSAVLANHLLRAAITRLRHTYVLLEDASLRSLELRFARMILHLAKLGATGDSRVRLQVRMHQDELADLLGVTTRSIINVLNKWRADQLVNFDGRTAQLTILNFDRFRALTEGE